MKKQLLIVMIMIAGFAGVVYVGLQGISAYREMKQKEIVQQAATGCSAATTATWKDKNGASIVEPYRTAFEQCLKDAGVK